MDFNYREATQTHLFEQYDCVPLIHILSYKKANYLLYAIDWDRALEKCEYMIFVITVDELKHAQTIGILSLLQQKLKVDELFHLTTGILDDSPPSIVRKLTKEESIEAFPQIEFVLDYDYLTKNN